MWKEAAGDMLSQEMVSYAREGRRMPAYMLGLGHFFQFGDIH
jgi:hypothetical protein